jgi:hypothetical protein
MLCSRACIMLIEMLNWLFELDAWGSDRWWDYLVFSGSWLRGTTYEQRLAIITHNTAYEHS